MYETMKHNNPKESDNPNRPTKALKISSINTHDIVVGTKKKKGEVSVTLGEKEETLSIQTPFLKVFTEIVPTSVANTCQFITVLSGNSKRDIKKFVQFVERVEDQIIQQVCESGEKWFSKKDVQFIPLIRETKGMPPHIKWPFDIESTSFIDDDKNEFCYGDILSNDLIKIIIEPSIWIKKKENQFGINPNIRKVWVKAAPPIPKKNIPKEYVFDDDSESISDSDSEGDVSSLLMTDQKIPNKKVKMGAKKKTVTFADQLAIDHVVTNKFAPSELPVWVDPTSVLPTDPIIADKEGKTKNKKSRAKESEIKKEESKVENEESKSKTEESKSNSKSKGKSPYDDSTMIELMNENMNTRMDYNPQVNQKTIQKSTKKTQKSSKKTHKDILDIRISDENKKNKPKFISDSGTSSTSSEDFDVGQMDEFSD